MSPSPMRAPPQPSNCALCLGIALLAGASLLHELVLTRLFSVLLWYHFAFAVISLALLGIGAGGVWIYVRRDRFRAERLGSHLVWCALGFGLAAPLGTLLIIRITDLNLLLQGTGAGRFFAVAFYPLQLLPAAVPFFFVGLAVGLAFTHRVEIAGRVYAADLTGAGLGCMAVVGLMDLTDLGGAVLTIGLLGIAAAPVFAMGLRSPRLMGVVAACGLVLAGLLGAQLLHPWLVVRATKLGTEEDLIWEKWNAYSRVTVFDPSEKRPPLGWGLSTAYEWSSDWPHEMLMGIDNSAGTPVTPWDGSPAGLAGLDHLDWDVTALGHQLRPGESCLIVGPGGGRDILTALRFGQRRTVAVEINPAVHQAMTGPFREFSGDVYGRPGVEIVVDEARSWLERSREQFELIQVSMIDTWAATAAGAFVFSEAHLYTVEAFLTFHERLAPGGILAVTRWYELPETLRLEALALEAWRRAGAAQPEQHMAILSNHPDRGVATLLLGRDPLTEAEIATLRTVAAQMDFRVDWVPDGQVSDSDYAFLARTGDIAPIAMRLPMNLGPPTDDQPFFFHMLRLRDLLGLVLGRGEDLTPLFHVRANYRATMLLVALVGVVTLFAVAFILGPLALARRADLAETRGPWRWRLLLYFTCLGLGFMLVEISQIQRLNLFLGHPIYAFAVVLATLLIAGGCGSFLARRWAPEVAPRRLQLQLPLLVALIAVLAWVQPALLRAGLGWQTPVRIGAAVAQLFPLGLLLGMPLPLGMQIAAGHAPRLIPWLWGVNGATSVVGSVGALCFGLFVGIQAALVVGACVYLVAWLLVLGRRASVTIGG